MRLDASIHHIKKGSFMKFLALGLVVTFSVLTFVGCKKKTEPVKTQQVTEQTPERVSGTHNAVDIVWEEVDLK